MGCGASASRPPPKGPPPEPPPKEKEQPPEAAAAEQPPAAAEAPPAEAAPPPEPAVPEAPPIFPGREKHMPYPALREVDQEGTMYYMSCFAHLGEFHGLTLSCRDQKGQVWSKAFTDDETRELKEQKVKELGWPSFWRALYNAFGSKDPPRAVAAVGGRRRLDIPLKSKSAAQKVWLGVELDPLGADSERTFTLFAEPFLSMYSKRKSKRTEAPGAAGGDGEEGAKKEEEGGKKLKEIEFEVKEAVMNKEQAQKALYDARITVVLPRVEPLRVDAQKAQTERQERQSEIDKVSRQLTRLRKGGRTLHHLDGMYKDGGARAFPHSKWAQQHEPQDLEVCEVTLALEAERIMDSDDPAKLILPPTDPKVKQMFEGLTPAARDNARKIMEVHKRLNDWDYNAFELDKLTNGGALLHTAWVLCYRYDLVRHFQMDPDVLRNFWHQVTRGYHPNAYHNQTHAADVLQITHYILGPGGMAKHARLSKEDELAALMAAGIHDYDHPGLNNNFHTRTAAYLAILYNDRSVLENHHCACVFEMMQHEKYDILRTLSEDQRKEVRETVVEMLLGTDMGNHAKIFSQFRRRLSEASDWYSRREDIRLALVMAIKMADISNCGRPRDLYLRWADNIASEFYGQGDAECQLRLSVSPFMDRRKHNPDFSKGQISFMNYIVIPLFEACAQMLPNLEFTVKLCTKNRDHWASMLKDPPSG